jgi:hypothetical protein
MKNKSRLAFEQLELEMQVLSKEEQRYVVGSTGSIADDYERNHPSGGIAPGSAALTIGMQKTDCFFQALAYANNFLGGDDKRNSSYFYNAYNSSYGNADGGVANFSIADAFASNFFVQQNINNSVPGNMDNFANGTGGVLIGTYTTSAGYQHAVIITHVYSNGRIDFYDPQNNIQVKNSPRSITHYLALTSNCQ